MRAVHKQMIGWAFSVAAFAMSAAAQTTVTNGNNGVSGQVPVYSGTATLGSGASSPITVSGGSVGIGTATPTAPLHVAKADAANTNIPMQTWDPLVANYGLTLSNYNSSAGIDYRFTQLNSAGSSASGYAMKGTDRNRLVGAVIGKAMGSLETGSGVVEVLVTLQ